MKVIVLLLILSSCIGSCIIQLVRGNSYEYLTPEEITLIHEFSSSEKLIPNHIYQITADDLKVELKKHNKSLVYLFANGCKSDDCLPMTIVSNYAKEHNLKLFLIMVDYFSLDKTLNQESGEMFYSIKSGELIEKNKKYLKTFKKSLGYYDFSNEEYLGGYVFFEKDTIIDIKRSI
ncbi:MAG: hypothetical protein ACI9XP_001075 [Lentimonas sp.]|jgi:hypothetical protein